jgi:hypothetical protein
MRSRTHRTAARDVGPDVMWLRSLSRRLRRLVTGLRNTVLPNEPDRTAPQPIEDEAHAPGHRRLGPPQQHEPEPARDRPGDHTVVDHRPGHVHKG